MTRWLRCSLSVSDPFVCRCLTSEGPGRGAGANTMRLQNINRSEPDPALFRVPRDYQIVDESGDQVEIKISRP